MIFFVVDDCKVIFDFNQTFGRVNGAAFTGIAGNFTFGFSRITMQEIFTGYPELLGNRFKGEQAFGTDFYTVVTGGSTTGR
jgi:hypothetical protein